MADRGCDSSSTNHTEDILSLAFSPDGKLLATASDDSTVRISEAASGAEMARLTTHKSGITSVAFSPDGQILATGSYDQTIKLTEVSNGRELATLRGHRNEIWMLAFSPDGRQLATASKDFTVKLWNVSPAILDQAVHPLATDVVAVNLTPRERYFWTAHGDADVLRRIKFWEPKTMQEQATVELPPLTNWIDVLAYEGGVLVAFSDGTIRHWDLDTRSEKVVSGGFTNLLTVPGLPAKSDILQRGWAGRTLRFFALGMGSDKAASNPAPSDWQTLIWNPVIVDGRQLIATAFDRVVTVWDLASRQKITEFDAHNQHVMNCLLATETRLRRCVMVWRRFGIGVPSMRSPLFGAPCAPSGP